MDPASREAVLAAHRPTATEVYEPAPVASIASVSTSRSGKICANLTIPPAPYLNRKKRLLENLPDLWSYINPFMLYGRHLGYKGNFERDLREHDAKALALWHLMEEVKKEALGFMRVRAVWQFFEAERDGNAIRLFAPQASSPLHTFEFPRQARTDGLCLSDYVLDKAPARDHIALFVVTAGEGIRERSQQWKDAGEFVKAHGIQALAIETAEASAEWLHRRIREEWGFADPESLTMHDRFTSKYRGKRYSFGYPACPNLDDQEGLWKLLRPEDIGVELTEGMMMNPEASVSALVFHHPDCAYFSAGEFDRSAA
jgi:5-methyltetrahydrofolate--homocysteine methyltransferase